MEKLNSVAHAYAVMLAYALLTVGNCDDLLNSYTTDCAYEELENADPDLAFYLTVLAAKVLANGTEEEQDLVTKRLSEIVG